MIEREQEALTGDLDGLVALLELANVQATELARLQAERFRLQEAFRRASDEYARLFDAGQLPVVELAGLAKIDLALMGTEDAIVDLLTKLEKAFLPRLIAP